MADTTPCAVHTLVEDIIHGRLGVSAAKATLAELDKDAPDVARDLRADGQAIATAHKFDFSTWQGESMALSEVLLETGFDMIDAGVVALPYPEVVFCQRYPIDGGGHNDIVVLLRSVPDGDVTGIEYRAFHKCTNVPEWAHHGFTTTFRRNGGAHHWINDPSGVFDHEDQEYWLGCTMQFVVSALAALSSKGPEIHTRPAPKDLNKRRARKGKVPIFEYRIVEIPAWAKAKAEGLGGTHASPRLHWRRGHVRHFRTGCTTLIRPCLVGAAENGFIHKDYAVAPVPAD